MKDELLTYVNETFPGLKHPVCIRFELGASLKNGSDERLKQVYDRAARIFESLFEQGQRIFLLIKDWETADPLDEEESTGYIYRLLRNQPFESERIEEEDPGKNTGLAKNTYWQSILATRVERLAWKKMLEGIANFEQGREPGIGQNVYMIDKERDIIFYMFDDRGCVVYANHADKIRYLYDLYRDWTVNYWRSELAQTFPDKG
ncbi:MAG: DUF3885 domain-containing protein [Peptococcaceae bacterium]|nr:DUF3885 domain-containing protein [Peptococcaceae bacterium]